MRDAQPSRADRRRAMSSMSMTPTAVATRCCCSTRTTSGGDMLPALARQHFQGTGDGVRLPARGRAHRGGGASSTTPCREFVPGADARPTRRSSCSRCASQDFGTLVNEVSRFATTFAAKLAAGRPRAGSSPQVTRQEIILAAGAGAMDGTTGTLGDPRIRFRAAIPRVQQRVDGRRRAATDRHGRRDAAAARRTGACS